MSVHVMSWVLRHSEERLGNRLTLLVYADHAHEDGTGSYPSIDTVASEARLSRSQVIRCVGSLVENGSLEEIGTRSSGVKEYRVVMGGGSQYDTPSTARGVASTTEGGRILRPEPSLEPTTSFVVANATTTAADSHALTTEFVDMARAQGTEPPRRIVGQIASELKKLSDEATEDELRAALKRLLERGLHPTNLPSALFDVRQRGSANGSDPLSDLLEAHDGKWPTGSRLVRGSSSAAYVHDPLGYDTPNHPVRWKRPTRAEILSALRKDPG